MNTIPLLALLVAGTVGACGGQAVIDPPTAGGGAGGGNTTSTTSTSSTTDGGGCGVAVCPALPPTAGQSCVCEPGLKCSYATCAATGMQTNASCGPSLTWQVEQEACLPVYCPNGILCLDGEVCLVTSTGFQVAFECVADPCAPADLACACASALCEADYGCFIDNPGQVTCECLNC